MKKNKVLTYLLSFTVFILLIAIDQITKILAVQHLKDQPSIDIIKDILVLTYVQNTGAAWGMMAGWQTFFIILTSIMFLAVVFIYIITPMTKKYTPMRVILVVLGAGAIGNLIDRIMNGYVHDFIYIKAIDFPVFNVADICVTVSMFVMIFLVIFKYKDDDFNYIKDFFKKNKKAESTDNEQ